MIGGPLHGLIGPVAFVLRALRHPLADRVLLRGRQVLVREGGRHDARVFCEDACDDRRSSSGSPGTIGATPLRFGFSGFVAEVEPHAGHARTLVRTVAAEAGLGHDRPDVAIEAHLRVPPKIAAKTRLKCIVASIYTPAHGFGRMRLPSRAITVRFPMKRQSAATREGVVLQHALTPKP